MEAQSDISTPNPQIQKYSWVQSATKVHQHNRYCHQLQPVEPGFLRKKRTEIY